MTQISFPFASKCSYFGCEQPVCQRDALLQSYGVAIKRYCQHHSDEIESLFQKKNLSEIITWKALAEGPRKK